MEEVGGRGAVGLSKLPADCVAAIISLTSPADACRLSLVSTTIRSAADSDAVWKCFLPSDYGDLLSRSSDPLALQTISSKKQLYNHFCHRPLLIDQGTKSFSLDKSSGKKCYMLGSRGMFIVWGDNPRYWTWSHLPDSRFPEVAVLRSVCWVEIRSKINTRMLSPCTNYAAYFVFKWQDTAQGFDYHPLEVSLGITGGEIKMRSVYVDPPGGQRLRYRFVSRRVGMVGNAAGGLRWYPGAVPSRRNDLYPAVRGDGWSEVELGEFFNEGGGEDRDLEMNVLEVKGGHWKSGLIFQGIEIRPKCRSD